MGKTAFFLYPNIEYACASGMSYICTDTKGDLFRNYAGIAKDSYGYNMAVIDLRNPTRSAGNNLLHMVNKYMDIWRADNNNLSAKARAEKYAKIISKAIINSSGDSATFGQNAFFYNSAEGLLTATDAEKFCNEKSAIFLILPEEDSTKYFVVSLFLQQFYREMLTVADENGGKLPNRVMIYADEIGTIPKIESFEE